MILKHFTVNTLLLGALALTTVNVSADEFTEADLERWQQQFVTGNAKLTH